MKRLLLILLPLFLIVGCSKSVDKEKTNSEWFDYYNNTDLSIMNKLSEIMNRHEGYPTKEFCTNEDQLNTESRTGYKMDGTPGTNFTKQYWSKIIFSPNGNGKILKGVRQTPFHSIQYAHSFDIEWYLQLNPSPNFFGDDLIYNNNNNILYKWSEKIEKEPISILMENFSREENIEFWLLVEKVKNKFMSQNMYVLDFDKRGFVKNEESWKNGNRSGEWKECYYFSVAMDKCLYDYDFIGRFFNSVFLDSTKDVKIREESFTEMKIIYYTLVDEYLSEISPENQYKIADVYLNGLREYENSIIEYKKVLEEYPKSSQAPHANFMIGYIYGNYLDSPQNARVEYNSFLTKYPDHELAPSVKFELKYLGLSLDEIRKMNPDES
jgi:tetratricopeptide (TPR) repeat protein|tara:strand:+ start:29 stop:1171 length:1143 start_codon:yes stop_codon:yes gene_type:complete